MGLTTQENRKYTLSINKISGIYGMTWYDIYIDIHVYTTCKSIQDFLGQTMANLGCSICFEKLVRLIYSKGLYLVQCGTIHLAMVCVYIFFYLFIYTQ